MFILRTVYKDKRISNEVLAERYNVCYKSNPQNDEFEKTIPFFKGIVNSDVFGFIICVNKIIALRKGNSYFVMSQNGCTFESITE